MLDMDSRSESTALWIVVMLAFLAPLLIA